MRILVTGSTGYIGSRLVPALLAEGHDVVAAMRDPDKASRFAWGEHVDTLHVDIEEESSIRQAVAGVEAVYYLVHSMAEGDFVERDRAAAEAVTDACRAAGVERIVYLSGLVPDGELSDHLRSRLEVEKIFLAGSVPATVLRAAMVIGSGSTSFELLRRLSERVPLTPLPAWMRKKLQPIAITDVLHLLVAAVRGEPRNRSYDVGGEEIVSYPVLLNRYAAAAGLRRLQLVVPGVPRMVVGRAVAAISQMPAGTVEALVDSLGHDMVCSEEDARVELADPNHEFLALDEALRRSLGADQDGTDLDGDPLAGAATDPAWSGGSVQVTGGLVQHLPRSALLGLLLGPRAGSAERQSPETLV